MGPPTKHNIHFNCIKKTSSVVFETGLARFSHPGKYRAVITGKYRPGKNLK